MIRKIHLNYFFRWSRITLIDPKLEIIRIQPSFIKYWKICIFISYFIEVLQCCYHLFFNGINFCGCFGSKISQIVYHFSNLFIQNLIIFAKISYKQSFEIFHLVFYYPVYIIYILDFRSCLVGLFNESFVPWGWITDCTHFILFIGLIGALGHDNQMENVCIFVNACLLKCLMGIW